MMIAANKNVRKSFLLFEKLTPICINKHFLCAKLAFELAGVSGAQWCLLDFVFFSKFALQMHKFPNNFSLTLKAISVLMRAVSHFVKLLPRNFLLSLIWLVHFCVHSNHFGIRFIPFLWFHAIHPRVNFSKNLLLAPVCLLSNEYAIFVCKPIACGWHLIAFVC